MAVHTESIGALEGAKDLGKLHLAVQRPAVAVNEVPVLHLR